LQTNAKHKQQFRTQNNTTSQDCSLLNKHGNFIDTRQNRINKIDLTGSISAGSPIPP